VIHSVAFSYVSKIKMSKYLDCENNQANS